MNILLCSLYYEKKRVTGANKRFDFFGKYLLKSNGVSVTTIVRDGEIPSWASNVIILPRYDKLPSILRRILYCLHLTVLFSKNTGVVINDFMPVPIWFSKKNTYYQLVHDIRNFTDYNRAGLKKLSTFFQKLQWKSVPNVLTVSEFTKKQLISNCDVNSESIFISYNGIEEEHRSPLVRDIDFMYIATFEKRKNHINLIKAFYSYIQNINPDACMYLVGRDLGFRDIILKLVEQLNLEKSVVFVDAVTENELNVLYERTRCFISPSLYEGFGMPIIEAMYFGCNIACSDIEVFREIAAEHATYFDPCDSESIMKGMQLSLINSNDDLDTIHYVKSKFLWNSITADFLKLVGK